MIFFLHLSRDRIVKELGQLDKKALT